jgi:hypothetical protein
MDEASIVTLQNEIAEIEQKLADKKHRLEKALATLEKQTADATTTQKLLSEDSSQASLIEINNHSPPEIKVALFRSMFRGREDVYAKRFESKKTGKSGYQPACRNEWVRGICEKPITRCGSCTQRSFEPVTDDVIKNHLTGFIVMGVYPLLADETCHFLAIDFDKETWREMYGRLWIPVNWKKYQLLWKDPVQVMAPIYGFSLISQSRRPKHESLVHF